MKLSVAVLCLLLCLQVVPMSGHRGRGRRGGGGGSRGRWGGGSRQGSRRRSGGGSRGRWGGGSRGPWGGGGRPGNKPGGNGKPNVILMLADDMGSDDLGYVNPEVISPNIDALANGGVKLTNNYVMNVCTPTRHCVMTGRYPFKSHMQHIVIFPMQQLCVPTDIKFLPQHMKDNGYKTFMTGKWHLGLCREECLPTSRGFDHLYGFYQGEQSYFEHMSGPGNIKGYDWRNQTTIDWSAKGKFNTFLMRDYLVDTITNYDEDEPFFMYVAWTNPHTPYEDCPKEYLDKYSEADVPFEGRRQYLGLVTALDDAIGAVVKALKDSGHYKNTIIIFSSDNGGEHGAEASNGKLRGSKGSMFEGGIKALAFVHGPNYVKNSGTEHDGLFHATDWLPTIMGMIGADNFDAAGNEIDGHDQSDMILNGGPSKRNDIVYNIDMQPMHMMGQTAVRVGDWKFLWGGYGATDGYYPDYELFYKDEDVRKQAGLGPYGGSKRKRSAFDFSAQNQADMTIILKMWAWVEDDDSSGESFLFNIAKDPTEKNNLANDPKYAAQLKAMKLFVLKQYRDGYKEVPLPLRLNNQAGNPANFNGTWSTGWCNDVDQTLAQNG